MLTEAVATVDGPGQVAANQSASSAESQILFVMPGVCIRRELAVKPHHLNHNGTAQVDDALACYERSHTAIVGLATMAA